MTPVQVRMARAALAMTLDGLAAKAGVPASAIATLEAGAPDGDPAAEARLRTTFESCGVEWLDRDGVRLPVGAARRAETVPLEQMNSANDE